MFTRREALFHALRWIASGGFFFVIWGYVKGSVSSPIEVPFDNPPLKDEVIFKEGVYLVGSNSGPSALSARCPHLGCQLIYDASEGCFKCPCHGSMFTRKGAWLKGPAKKDMILLDIVMDDRCGACKVTLPRG